MRQLGELEAVIMDRLWEWGRPALVREMVDDLRDDRPIAYTTVMTVMDNLRKKGWLRRRQEGRAYLYEPAVTSEEYSAGVMREALAGSRDRAGTLMHFIGDLSAEEASALAEAYRLLAGPGKS